MIYLDPWESRIRVLKNLLRSFESPGSQNSRLYLDLWKSWVTVFHNLFILLRFILILDEQEAYMYLDYVLHS